MTTTQRLNDLLYSTRAWLIDGDTGRTCGVFIIEAEEEAKEIRATETKVDFRDLLV